MTALVDDSLILDRVRTALSRIASVHDLGGKISVSLPIMYPSGASVVVEIERNGDKYWVSDIGYGYVEAELVGAQTFYEKIASAVADDFGIGYDGNAMFALWVDSTKLESAIICVANASNRASSEALLRATEAKTQKHNEKIFDRIKMVFGNKAVARTANLVGKHTQWEAHNVVVFPNRHRAVFEHMTAHTTSVSAKFLMFSDIKSVDQEISLNVMVKDVTALDQKGQMVGDLANILPMSASDDQLKEFARAV